ncbi:MAG TPA: TlpA disulfide reductase family protein [Longimicrobiales bacterium]
MMGRFRGWLPHGLVFAALAGLITLGWLRRDRFDPVAAGDRAPDYAAVTLAGDTLSLASLRGNIVLLNVWATWCAPCRREMPALERLYRALRDRGLRIVAVSVDAAPGGVDALGNPGGDVRAMVRDLGLSFTVLLDPRAEVRRRFGVNALPTTFLIDRSGRIVERVLGPAPWDEPPYADRVRALLEG